ncbi:MAG: phytoene desaturase family protein [Thermoanaerobaculia bacterium]
MQRRRAERRGSRAKKVVIVGAGPGGLANAMLLAQAGFDVEVLEKQAHVGGRTSTISENGFHFDLGPTFFLYPQVLESIFSSCGMDLHDEVDLIRLDPHYRLLFEEGGELEITPDIELLKKRIAALAPGDAQHLDRFMSDNREKLAAFKPILESPMESLKDLLGLSLFEMLPLLRPWKSVDQDLSTYFQDPRVRLAFSFQSKYLGMSPFRCPSLFTILSFLEYEHGVFHPRGGCGAVSQAMARAAEKLGARIHLNEPVEEILFEGRKAVGVRSSTGVRTCDALVVNADFAHAMSHLVPNHLRKRWTDEKLEKKKFSCSTFMMYLGVEGRLDDLAHHTIYLADDYRQNLREIEDDHVLSAQPSFYVQNPTVTDPEMAPQGMSSLYVLVPVTHQHPNVDWNRDTEDFRKVVVSQLEKVGVDDLDRRIRYEKILTPSHWETEQGIYRGATFNLAHTWGQMLSRRPHNRFEDLESVYLVGGGTHPGSGLPVIFESAKITSQLIEEDARRVRKTTFLPFGSGSQTGPAWQQGTTMQASTATEAARGGMSKTA